MSKVWHARANGGGRRRDFDAELSNTSPRTAYPRISETIIRGAAHDSLDTKMCPLDPALTLLPERGSVDPSLYRYVPAPPGLSRDC